MEDYLVCKMNSIGARLCTCHSLSNILLAAGYCPSACSSNGSESVGCDCARQMHSLCAASKLRRKACMFTNITRLLASS